jgi:hypothetical protein
VCGETEAAWAWEVATDAAEVHELLCACDRYQAAGTGSPVPSRCLETTERHVRDGAVHVLRRDGVAAMFTLTREPPFKLVDGSFPAARRPVYLQRLAVRPHLLRAGSFVGIRCVRKAVEVAAADGADALRCEANPDLVATRTLLEALGFRQHGPVYGGPGQARRVYLHKELPPARAVSPAAQ